MTRSSAKSIASINCLRSMHNVIIIPPDQLSTEALQGVIEEFITREGTDYGAMEIELADKVRNVRAQLSNGTALIVFDPIAEACTIISRDEYRARQ